MKVLLSVIFFALANGALAEDMRYYDVEIVIIENLRPKAKLTENWPVNVILDQPEKTITLGEPVISEWLPEGFDTTESYKLLKSDTYQLTKHVEKISESDTQRVIFHTAWRQPGLDKNLALPIYFKREIPAAPMIAKPEQKENSTEETADSEVLNQEIAPLPSTLEGILRVTLARYLHLEAELTYRDEVPENFELNNPLDAYNPFSALETDKTNINSAQKQQVIYLKQKRRRIRSNELHYLEHPVLGMLVRMTPYEKPEEVVIESKKVQNSQSGSIRR